MNTSNYIIPSKSLTCLFLSSVLLSSVLCYIPTITTKLHNNHGIVPHVTSYPYMTFQKQTMHLITQQQPNKSNKATCFGVLLSGKSSTSDEKESPSSPDADAKIDKQKNRRKRRKKGSVLKEAEDPSPIVSSIEDSSISVDEIPFDGLVEIQVQDINSSKKQESGATTTTMTTKLSSTSKNNGDDKLKTLLDDAKRLRASEPKTEGNAMLKIRDIISTVVAVDFFVVFGFLIWFITGAVSSSIVKDDTIQLAFNALFQPVVQPAIGILMIASIASGVTGQDTTES